MDWKKKFSRHIVQRGYEYFLDNAVEDFAIKDDIIYATVTGSEDYKVEIDLINGNVSDMYCSCPYASEGKNCKHMAAVLYEWSEKYAKDVDLSEEDLLINAIYREKKELVLEEVVRNANEEELRFFVTLILREDENLFLRFYKAINAKKEKIDIDKYKKKVDNIARKYSKKNFIDYEIAYYFVSDILEFLENDIKDLLYTKNYKDAFDLTIHIVFLLDKISMDDSDGGLGNIMESIYSIWLEILQKVSREEKTNIFNWFIANLNGVIIDYLEEYFEEILFEEFQEKEYYQYKLDLFKSKLDNARGLGAFRSNFYSQIWAIRYLTLLKTNISEKELRKACKEYWDLSEVRRFYIDFCMENENYKEALEVLDESIVLDEGLHGLIRDYCILKKDIYYMTGDMYKYIEQLEELLTKHRACELEYYKELKSQYSEEEWLVKREDIIKKLQNENFISEIYEEEKLYDRLLKFVSSEGRFYYLERYLYILKKHYPKEVLHMYEKELESMVEYAGDRKKYGRIANMLRTMKKIEGGDMIVERIIDEWREKYKKRRALLEEISYV